MSATNFNLSNTQNTRIRKMIRHNLKSAVCKSKTCSFIFITGVIWEQAYVLVTVYFRYSNGVLQIPTAARSKAWNLLPFACWDCGFEAHWEHGFVSLVIVVFCQAEVYMSGWSVIQRGPTEFSVSECDSETQIMRIPWPTRGCWSLGKTTACWLL